MNEQRVKVRRDGPRGWHWIAMEHYDPTRHERLDEVPAAAPKQHETEPKRRGRPPKSTP